MTVSANVRTLHQLMRYTIVGGVAFVVDFGSLYCLAEFGKVHYLVSAALAFTLGLVVNYSMSVSWVFSRRNVSNRYAEFTIFAVVGVVGLGLNHVFMFFFTEKIALFYLQSKLISTALVFLWNFFGRKLLLFR
jgi:putative flippase GtrA